ncbi:hypothetical protein IGI04_029664 [Brassica rapa subsp. trilocularis]|uniref:Uncharacterized protein n=1 Tax=Brassica rapa subsp. trilocularis TaxID=1813537 RepID=A0ABQ7LR95_BRACM|nr:hypothetical protein IGI04_029664 [Brassica rapa subsp. trilocularis]
MDLYLNWMYETGVYKIFARNSSESGSSSAAIHNLQVWPWSDLHQRSGFRSAAIQNLQCQMKLQARCYQRPQKRFATPGTAAPPPPAYVHVDSSCWFHNGKVLKGETTLVEIKVMEEDVLVVMLSKFLVGSDILLVQIFGILFKT